MPIAGNVSGTWRYCYPVKGNVSGTWRSCPYVWGNVSGVWYDCVPMVQWISSMVPGSGTVGYVYYYHPVYGNVPIPVSGVGYIPSLGIGSMSDTTFLDTTITTHTITTLAWHQGLNALQFSLDGSHPDSDLTFKSVSIGASVYNRSDRATYGVSGGDTVWQWGSPNPFTTGVSNSIVVKFK